MLRRFNQRSVHPSNLRLDGPEKVRRREALCHGHPSNLLTSSNLSHTHTHTRVRGRGCACARTRVQTSAPMSDKVRTLDGFRYCKGFVSSNLPSNLERVSRHECK